MYMPKISYANTKIYLVQCKNKLSTDVFFGHCTNIIKFRCRVKTDVENGKNTVLHNTIRENGGFKNWSITIIENFDECMNKMQADQRVMDVQEKYFAEKRLEKADFQPEKADFRLKKSAESAFLLKNNENTEENNDKMCSFCSKVFSKRSNMLAHQRNNCKHKKPVENIEKLEQTIAEQKTIIHNLENQLAISNKGGYNNNNNNNTNSHNNTNIQNNIQNNNIILEIGNENFADFLTKKQKLRILQEKYTSLDYFVQNFHCNKKYPQFQSIKVPSLTKSHCDAFSQKDQKFIAKNMNDTVEQLVDYRVGDIESFLDVFPDLPENTGKAVRDMVGKLGSDAKYKKEKCAKIKLDIYNKLRKTDA